MTENAFISEMKNCYSDVTFKYKGNDYGIFPEVHNSSPVFHVVCGENSTDCGSLADLLDSTFFDNVPLRDILMDLDLHFS